MAEYFAGGHLRFMDGEWRDDDGNVIEISTVRHGRWLDGKCTVCGWEEPDVCTWLGYDSEAWIETPYCPNCGCKMGLEG